MMLPHLDHEAQGRYNRRVHRYDNQNFDGGYLRRLHSNIFDEPRRKAE